MRTEFLGISVLRVASGPRVKLASCRSALNPPVICSTDRSKAVVRVLVLLFVALWFIIRGDLLYIFPCFILFLCFSVLLVLRLPRLGKRELILVLFVRLFGLCLFRFVGFLFLLGSGKGCGLWLWHSLDFSLTFFSTYHKLFNIILDTGKIPSSWTGGCIIPIYKKKCSKLDPENYRPTTLLSCLGKLFTAIINSRLQTFSNDFDIIQEKQTGFRKQYSTIDNVFALHVLFDLLSKSRRNMYCAFISTFRKPLTQYGEWGSGVNLSTLI